MRGASSCEIGRPLARRSSSASRDRLCCFRAAFSAFSAAAAARRSCSASLRRRSARLRSSGSKVAITSADTTSDKSSSASRNVDPSGKCAVPLYRRRVASSCRTART